MQLHDVTGHFINVIPGPDLLRHPHLPGVYSTNQGALRLVLWRFLPAAEQMPECRHGILEENAAAAQKDGGWGDGSCPGRLSPTQAAGATLEKVDEMCEPSGASFSFLRPSESQNAGRDAHLGFILLIFP